MLSILFLVATSPKPLLPHQKSRVIESQGQKKLPLDFIKSSLSPTTVLTPTPKLDPFQNLPGKVVMQPLLHLLPSTALQKSASHICTLLLESPSSC